MFKVILTGKIYREPRFKEINDRTKVCNFTIKCPSSGTKYESYVRCSIWGNLADEFMAMDYKDKNLYIEGNGIIQKQENIDGTDNYTFNLKCERIEILD